jgi:hypothetical protein
LKIILTIIILINLNLFSTEIRKNIEIIDSLANVSYYELLDSLKQLEINNFSPIFNNSPEYLKTIFISKMYEMNFNKTGDNIDINILKYKPKYKLENDSLKREIIFLISSNYLGIFKNNIFIDKISKDDINYIEDSEFQFDKAILQKEKSSFWKKYLEPIIIVGSSLITVLLLFTVRSS